MSIDTYPLTHMAEFNHWLRTIRRYPAKVAHSVRNYISSLAVRALFSLLMTKNRLDDYADRQFDVEILGLSQLD